MELLMLRQSQCTSGRSTGLGNNKSFSSRAMRCWCLLSGWCVCMLYCSSSNKYYYYFIITVVLLIFFCSGSSSTHHKTLTICLLEVKTSSGKKS